jgi:hypothetical protein
MGRRIQSGAAPWDVVADILDSIDHAGDETRVLVEETLSGLWAACLSGDEGKATKAAKQLGKIAIPEDK